MIEHIQALPGIRQTIIMMLGIAVAFAAMTIFTTSNAQASYDHLLPRVNEGLRDAGIPVTPKTQQKFATRVVTGDFTDYDHLVNTMKWHKQRYDYKHGEKRVKGAHDKKNVGGAHFKKIAKTAKVKGEVAAFHANKIELINVEWKGQIVNLKFDRDDKTKIANNSIRRGSVVEVTYNIWTKHADVITNLAPDGEKDFYGPVDCSTCETNE